MKVHSSIYRLFLPFLLLASLCACSRYIEGDVFLDKNSNNIRDFGESVVSGIQYSVTQDGKGVHSGLTDDRGHFTVLMDSSKIDINYCVNIEAQEASGASKSSEAGKALEDNPEATADACPLNGLGNPDCNNEKCCDNAVCAQSGICKEKDKDEDGDCAELISGEPDCTDQDCCEVSECSQASACEGVVDEKDDEDKDACPKDSKGDATCSDSRCADEPACETHIVKSKQACNKSKAAELTMKLDVPVAIDYSTRIAKVEKSTQTVYVGDTIGLEIVYPNSCTFQPFVLPKAFKVSLGQAFDVMTREVFLAKAVAERPSQLFHKDAPPFGHDELVTYLLPVEVVGDQSLEDVEYQIQPKLKCPDGKEVLSNVQILLLKNSPAPSQAQAYELSSEISAGCPELDESGVLTSLIENMAGDGLAESTYTLTIAGGANHVALEDLPEFCHQVGPTVECDIEGSASSSKLGLAFNFTVSASIPKPATIVFTPKLTVVGAVFDDTPISCHYE